MYHNEVQYQSNIKQTPHLNQYQRRCQECWTPHQGPHYFCMNWFNEFPYLESWSLFMLIKKNEKPENYLETVKMHIKRKMVAKVYGKWGFLLPRRSLKMDF